jgi:hypothetical protein
VTDIEDIAALTRIIERLRNELRSATSDERRRWLTNALEVTIDIRAHIAFLSGIELPD